MVKKILLTIKKIGINGEGIGYYRKKITFVKGALPDEIVVCEIQEENKKYIKAKLLSIKEKSIYRRENIRPEFLKSGAYSLIHVNYEKQLELKKSIVIDALDKYLKIKNVENKILDVIPSPLEYHYRNKNQFPVAVKSGKIIAGLYKEGTNELVDIKDCIALHKTGNRLTELCKKYIAKYKIPVSISKKNKGIKYISTRTSFHNGDVQIIFVSNINKIENLNKVIEDLRKEKEVKSIILNITNDKNHLVMGEKNILLYGDEYITEKIGNVKYKLSANSFFQLNPLQTKNLYEKILELAEIKKEDIILDAFCGVGTIGQYVSKYCKKVYGVDIIEEAIKDAKENLKLNKIKNCHYEVGDVAKVIPKLKNEGIKFDVAIVDPPRKGLESLARELVKTNSQKIIYVSCNPSTLAKDLKILTKKYKLKTIQPIDMFPNTQHVECVVLLTR